MVNKRIIHLLNVKPVEEIAFVDENKITPVYGRTYVTAHKSGLFTIRYEFHSSREHYFERSGNYSNVWNINGSLEDIKVEQRKLENGEIRVVFSTSSGGYERSTYEEKRVRDQLRKDVRKFELWRHGDPKSIEWEFKMEMCTMELPELPDRGRCPGFQARIQRG